MRECPSCARENGDDARFCSGCGEQLAAVSVEEIRKTVTIVFCDLVGSTALGERLDPESVRGAIGRYFDEARVAIERHGGTVEKFIGDAVMSVFGIPRLHEDDALRAVRAAVDLRDAVSRLGDELEEQLGIRIQARIGVATGEVVAGDHSPGHGFVTGDVVNVAARLEQAAGADEVLVGERTHALVQEAVRAEPVEPLELKGKSAPIAAWRLLEVMDRPATMTGVDSPFVGRERELEALSAALARAVQSRSCQLCTLVGAPGIGKSRLADEFTAAASAHGHRVVVGRCLPYGDGITFWPLAEIVHAVGGQAEIGAVLGEGDDATLIAERIAGAIGTAEPSGPPEETFWAFRRFFESIAREQPLIVVVDELQWAEPTLLDLVEYLVAFAANEPILVLCLARPELFDERPSWAAPRRDATVVTLEPLAESESARLVHALAATHGVGDADLDRILETAEGNPLFLEQLLTYRATDDERGLAVPPTIQALLAARIDRLEIEERTVILRAAVEGKTFHRGAVGALLPKHARPMLGARLISLVRQELIRADRSQFPGDDGFRFGHSLIHDAAYQAAPKELRAEAHERYAGWLEERAGEYVLQYEEILGYHLEQAHRFKSELGREDANLASRASSRLGAAGERALARGDVPAAVNLLGRAVTLGRTAGDAAAELLYAMGIARNESGDLERADEAFSDAISRAERDGDSRLATRASLERVSLRELTGRATGDDVCAEVERAIPLLEQYGDEAGLARAWLRLSNSSHTFADAEKAAEQAFLHARRARRPREEEDALFARLSGALYGERPIAEVTQLCEQLLADAHGPLAEVGSTEILAALKVRAGDLAEGRELYRRADQLYRELGMKHREAVNWQCWGRSELATGHCELAETAFRESIDAFREIGDSWFVNAVRAHLAHAVSAQGRFDEADAILDGCAGILATSARARVLAARGDIDAALALAHEALAAVSAVDCPEGRAQVLVALAEVCRAADRPAEEAGALRDAIALYEHKGIKPAVKRVRLRLDEIEASARS